MVKRYTLLGQCVLVYPSHVGFAGAVCVGDTGLEPVTSTMST
jgi:hypothetical protein